MQEREHFPTGQNNESYSQPRERSQDPAHAALQRYLELSNTYKTLGLRKAQYGLQLREVEKTIPKKDGHGHYDPSVNMATVQVSHLLAQELAKEINRINNDQEQSRVALVEFRKSLAPEIAATIPDLEIE